MSEMDQGFFFCHHIHTVSKQTEPFICGMTEPLYQEMKNGQNVKLAALFLVFFSKTLSVAEII